MTLRAIRSTRRLISARGAARECHHQNSPGIGAVHDQMGHPVRQRIGFAGSRACDDEQRRSWRTVILEHAMLNRLPLLNIESVEIGRS